MVGSVLVFLLPLPCDPLRTITASSIPVQDVKSTPGNSLLNLGGIMSCLDEDLMRRGVRLYNI